VETEGKRHELGARGYSYLPEGFPTESSPRKRAGLPLLKSATNWRENYAASAAGFE